MRESIVLNEEQLACLASPVRNRVHGTLRELGEASGRQIGEAIGKSPETVHYHLKALERAGLIEESARRPAPKKPESTYRPASLRLTLPSADADPKIRQLMTKAVSAGMRQFVKGYEKSAASEGSPARLFNVLRANIQLRSEHMDRFMEMIEEAGRFAVEHRDASGEAVQWLSAVYPIG